MEDQTRQSAREYASKNFDKLVSSIPLEALVSAAAPVVAEVVKLGAQNYFTKTQAGQSFLFDLIKRVCDEDGETVLREKIGDRLGTAAMPLANGRTTMSVP